MYECIHLLLSQLYYVSLGHILCGYKLNCRVFNLLLTGAVTEVEVLGCGIISWKPPPGNEGLALGYIIRFFDGPSFDASASGYRSVQRHLDDIGRQWARADNIPTDGRTVYADVRRKTTLFLFNLHAYYLFIRSEQGILISTVHFHKDLLLLVSKVISTICIIQKQ